MMKELAQYDLPLVLVEGLVCTGEGSYCLQAALVFSMRQFSWVRKADGLDQLDCRVRARKWGPFQGFVYSGDKLTSARRLT